jgi:teichuronic acid biosynthesis glycosyltransferase TuaG
MEKTIPPKVSVVIPFYNCPYVDRAIKSVLVQTYPRIELIIVNDGSTRYNHLIRPYLNLPHVVYIEKENGGTASALNLGITHAQGQLFSWLSSDDVFDSNKVVEQVMFMIKNNACISYTNFNLIDANDRITDTNVGLHFNDQSSFLKHLLSSCPVNGSTVMLKMEVFKVIGLFNESLLYTQDYDFWIRAAHNYVFHSLNKTLLNYRIHDAMGTKKHRPEQDHEVQLIKEKYRESLERLISNIE